MCGSGSIPLIAPSFARLCLLLLPNCRPAVAAVAVMIFAPSCVRLCGAREQAEMRRAFASAFGEKLGAPTKLAVAFGSPRKKLNEIVSSLGNSLDPDQGSGRPQDQTLRQSRKREAFRMEHPDERQWFPPIERKAWCWVAVPL